MWRARQEQAGNRFLLPGGSGPGKNAARQSGAGGKTGRTSCSIPVFLCFFIENLEKQE